MTRGPHQVSVAREAKVMSHAREVSLMRRGFREPLQGEAKSALGSILMHRFARARAKDAAQMERRAVEAMRELVHRMVDMWDSDELRARRVRQLTTAARRASTAVEHLRPLLVRECERARHDRKHLFLERQPIDLTSLGSREQCSLPEIQRRRAWRPLEPEWPIRFGHRRLERARDLTGNVVGYAEPIAPVPGI